MTNAVIADQLGALENYRLRHRDPGNPGPGQVRIAVKAAGVSFVDILNARGQYQAKAPVPFVPGSEFAGIVDALGPGCHHLEVGQSVIATCWGGAFAEAAVVAADNVHPMPGNMDFPQAAVFKVSALTAWHGLVDRARLQTGETLLVLGAGGATGYAAVQIGHYLGARVIASASSAPKRQMAMAGGAHYAVDATSPQWRGNVKSACDHGTVDVVFDPVGGPSTEAAFRTLGWQGRHLVVGFPRGIASLASNLPLLKAASLMGVNLQQQARHAPQQAAANLQQILALGGTGLFTPVIARSYPLVEFRLAMAEVERGNSAGRIVLTMP